MRGVRWALVAVACVVASVASAAAAWATPATGGVGRFGGAIDWVSWGAKGEVLDLSGPITRESVTTFAGRELRVSCTISNFAGVGGPPVLSAYASGGWRGDALDDLYNIGGTGTNNQLVSGLWTGTRVVSFDFSCTATLDGSPYPLAGIVFADAEQSTTNEGVAGTIPVGATWRLIDRHRSPGCAIDSQVTRTISGADQTLRLDNPPGALCGSGPAAVAFADGATAGRITVDPGGASAVALGAVLTVDHGDAPASYGDALHASQYGFSGGEPPVGTTALFAGNTLADTAQPALRLGPSVDPEGTVFSDAATADDISASGAFGPGDDETEAPPASIFIDRGDPFTHTVACSGAGTVAGWIDWDDSGTFDADERASVPCLGGSAALSWTVPGDAVQQGRSFMRLRYAADPAEVAAPAGFALSGEAEDHAFTISMPPDLAVSKSAPTVVEPGGQVTWTIVVRNIGPGTAALSTFEDPIPAGITNVSAVGCAVAGDRVRCVVLPITPGSSRQIQVTGTAPATPSTCFTNAATISVSQDRDTSNNAGAVTTCTRPPLSDVRIEKSASAPVVLHGDEVRYTLRVTNAGPDPAENVTVADAAGAGVTPITASTSQGSCATASACSLGTVAPNQTVTIEIVARASELGTHGNTATVSTTTAETDPANNAASATILVEPQADVRIAKTASATTLTEGDDFTYTLTVRNDGPSTAVDAVVTDSIPAGVIVRSVRSSRGSCGQGDPVVCALGDLADGATATITIEATATAAGSPVNTAIVTSPTPDPNHANNQDATRLTTSTRANLSITKAASARTLLVGESFTYTLTVRNDGPSSAVGAVVTDRIPDGLRLQSATSPCAGAPVVVCELGTLARGQERTLRFTVSAQRAGAFPNTASVTSETPEADATDNLDDAYVEAGTRADLMIDKTVGTDTVVAGQTVVYGLVITNRGPHDATNVTVTDPIPYGMRLVSATPSTGRCAGTPVLTCALGDLANGASATIRVQAVAEQAGPTRNVASVTSPTPDPDPTNNQDETTITSEKADLTITKRTRRTVALGGRLTYTLAVRNDGPSAARGVVVTDPVPDGLRITATSASAGSCEIVEGAIVCRLGDLAAGATITVTVKATAVRPGRIDNAASVVAGFPSDPDLTDNLARARVTVRPGAARIAVSKRTRRATVASGDRVRYRIVIRNRGARTAHHVQVCDRLPAGLAFVRRPGSQLRRGQACWTLRTLAPRAARTFRVIARVLDGRNQRLVNTARATGANTRAVRDRARVRRVDYESRAGGVTG